MEMAFSATSFFSHCLEILSLLSFLYCFHVPQTELTGRPSHSASMDSPLP